MLFSAYSRQDWPEFQWPSPHRDQVCGWRRDSRHGWSIRRNLNIDNPPFLNGFYDAWDQGTGNIGRVFAARWKLTIVLKVGAELI